VRLLASSEVTIAIQREMGVGSEDCIRISENSPRPYAAQSASIEQPFA
jgi:hypothetical protein